jgi:hypothetical protein
MGKAAKRRSRPPGWRERRLDPHLVTVGVNPHGTSQYCSRCGRKGERFSSQNGQRLRVKWGKLFWCPYCRYEANADFNASANMHHSFYHEMRLRLAQLVGRWESPAMPGHPDNDWQAFESRWRRSPVS